MKLGCKTILLAIMLIVGGMTLYGQKMVNLQIARDDTNNLTCSGVITPLDHVANYSVIWQITDSNIKDFKILGRFIHPGPFRGRIEGGFQSTPLIADLDPYAAVNSKWEYYILWHSKTSSQLKTCDPKIAINPSPKLISPLLLGLLIAFAGVFFAGSVVFFTKWRTAVKDLRNLRSNMPGNVRKE